MIRYTTGDSCAFAGEDTLLQSGRTWMLFPKKKLNGRTSQLIVLFLEQNKLSMGDMIMQHCSYELLLQANGKRQSRGYNDIEGKALSHQRLIEIEL